MTDPRLIQGMAAINNSMAALEMAVVELIALFPGTANAIAWKEAVSNARGHYQQSGLADDAFLAAIAQRWVALAKNNKLEATMNQAVGLIVRETA